jgi:hypothetical protein
MTVSLSFYPCTYTQAQGELFTFANWPVAPLRDQEKQKGTGRTEKTRRRLNKPEPGG